MISSGFSSSPTTCFRLASFKLLTSPFYFLTGLIIAAAFAKAADSSWIPTGGVQNWTTSADWTAGVPGAASGTTNTDIATFGDTPTSNQVINVDSGRNIGGITFSNTTSFDYLLRTINETLNLTNGGVIQTINATGSHADQVDTALVIQGNGGTATFTAGAGSSSSILTFGAVTGVSTASNTTTLTLNGSNTGDNIIAGVMGNGSAGGNLAVIKSGTGNWTLSNVNTFTGGLTIKSGTLTVASSSSALGGSGTGAVTLGDTSGTNSASLIVSAASLGTIANPITLATNATSGPLTIGTGGNPPVSITFSGGVTGTNNFTIYENGGTGTITFSGGSINNTGTVTNSGIGTGTTLISSVIGTNVSGVTQNSATAALNLTANNTYSGSTTVTSGTLFVNNSSGSGTGTGSLSVASAGILAGTGTIGSSSNSISGALNPGNNGIGILTFSNGVTLNSGSATTVEISGATTRGTDFDGVNFNGSLTVNGGDLTLSFGSTSIADGTTLDIFSGAALTANFTNVIASGTNYSGTLTLNGGNTAYEGYFGSQLVSLNLATGDLAFTAIPEPSTFAVIIGATVLGFGIRRRRLKRM